MGSSHSGNDYAYMVAVHSLTPLPPNFLISFQLLESRTKNDVGFLDKRKVPCRFLSEQITGKSSFFSVHKQERNEIDIFIYSGRRISKCKKMDVFMDTY